MYGRPPAKPIENIIFVLHNSTIHTASQHPEHSELDPKLSPLLIASRMCPLI